jgi:hypothetical protein
MDNYYLACGTFLKAFTPYGMKGAAGIAFSCVQTRKPGQQVTYFFSQTCAIRRSRITVERPIFR